MTQKPIGLVLVLCGLYPLAGDSLRQTQPVTGSGPVAQFDFDGNTDNATGASVDSIIGGTPSFVDGLDGQALSFEPGVASAMLTLGADNLPLSRSEDFSVQCWIRTTVDSSRRMAVLSHKEFADNSLASQKQAGWVFYVSGGTWAWNMGSGDRRITYERDNGEHMPVNDGRWHQLTMTHDSARSEIRLFYDGETRAVYNVSDAVGFDFTSIGPVVAGWAGTGPEPPSGILPAIQAGADTLQQLVDAFNRFGLKAVESADFVNLIVDPRRLFDEKVTEMAEGLGPERSAFLESMEAVDFGPVSALEAELMRNPYTVHQVVSFMEVAPLMQIFSLVDGTVTIDRDAAEAFAARERLDPPDFDMDELAMWDRALSTEEVLSSYSRHFTPVGADREEALTSLTTASWNIFHGGKHYTVANDGWDSRVAIAEMLKREDVDVVMMQETYSSGDFIAAELGYYFATTVDWDYLNQGSNISVLSRYPITAVYVQEDSPFMNVAARIAISETQDLYAMSNWYGMQQFPAVFEFHQARFQESDTTPTVFAGDFNAVPHTDGGTSYASQALLDAGFTDAFRDVYPDSQEYPGPTHRSGRRIDQLYYKGAGLKNTATKLVSTEPTGFPSDHFLIVSTFELDYATRRVGPQARRLLSIRP